jgi:hypothetical protein
MNRSIRLDIIAVFSPPGKTRGADAKLWSAAARCRFSLASKMAKNCGKRVNLL